MKILVLFDGAGLARLGLEQAGHECLGVELDPTKHALSRLVGSGNCVLGDARLDVSQLFTAAGGYDACWCSPPCAQRSSAIKDLTGMNGYRNPQYQQDHLQWCLNLPFPILWVENVTVQTAWMNDWGTLYNAAQFLPEAVQCRNRVIGGRYKNPERWIYRPYRRAYPGLCPCISATEWKGCATDKLRASRFYGRKLTLEECAYHQGFDIPAGWSTVPDWFMPDTNKDRQVHWLRNQYEAIGNGVPVYMARAFARIYT